MASEKSYQDRLQKSRGLAEAVALLDPAYAPADAQYALAALNAAVGISEAANAEVETQRIPFTDASSDRVALVKTVGPLATQALAYVKSNTAWPPSAARPR